MTNPLSGPSRAQQFTEMALQQFPKCAGLPQQLNALESLAKKIVPLFERSRPPHISPCVPKPVFNEEEHDIERYDLGKVLFTKKYASKYAQKCVLTHPDLFPYFSQFFPDLISSFEQILDQHLKSEDNSLLAWNLEAAVTLLCDIMPETTEAMEMLIERIDKASIRMDLHTKLKFYAVIIEKCNSDQLTNYVFKAPDANGYLISRIISSKIREDQLLVPKICALLARLNEAWGLGPLPSWIEPQILEIKDSGHQRTALVRLLGFLHHSMNEQMSLDQFALFVKNPLIWIDMVAACSNRQSDLNQMIFATAENEANKKTAEETFQTVREKYSLNELMLLPESAKLFLLVLSLAPTLGVSKEVCDALVKQVSPYFTEGAHLDIFNRDLMRILQNKELDPIDKEYLLDKVSKEPSPFPCMRLIQTIEKNGGFASLKKNKLEKRTFIDILRETCLSGEAFLPAIAQVHDAEMDPEKTKMTAEILNFEGFIKEAARDLNYSLKSNQTVAEVQGCSAFCEKVLEYAIENPSVLSPSSLGTLQTITGLILRIKRLGHAFNLRGMVKLPNDTLVNLEGFNETFVVPMLRATFDEFASLREDLVSQELKDFVQESLATATWHDNASDEKIAEIHKLIHDPEYKYPVVVGSGWDWHATQVIFYKGNLYYCNRGVESGFNPGITVLKIGNKDKITPEFLKRIASRLSVDKSAYTSLKEIKEELGAYSHTIFFMKAQRVGNCVYSNLKAVIYVLVILGKPAHQPLTLGKKIYQAFSQFDKEALVEDLLIDLEKTGTEENKGYVESLNAAAHQFENWLLAHGGKKQKISTDLYMRAITLLCQRGINL